MANRIRVAEKGRSLCRLSRKLLKKDARIL
jgi:hypothetical protein